MLPDLQEETEARPVSRLPCAIDIAVGSEICVLHQRFDVCISKLGGRGPRLNVSRYYWDLDPPVAVDFVSELRFGEEELAVKKSYFADRGIRYALAKDIWDGESVEAALAKQVSADKRSNKRGRRPVTGPRRRRSA